MLLFLYQFKEIFIWMTLLLIVPRRSFKELTNCAVNVLSVGMISILFVIELCLFGHRLLQEDFTLQRAFFFWNQLADLMVYSETASRYKISKVKFVHMHAGSCAATQ